MPEDSMPENSMNVKLVVIGGEADFKEVDLALPARIGRAGECTVVLPHRLVSRNHCDLFERDGKLIVRDLGSLNGTFVANERVTEAELPSSGLLTVGHITFRAIYGTQAAAGTTGAPTRRTLEVPGGTNDSLPIGADDETQPVGDDTAYDDRSSSAVHVRHPQDESLVLDDVPDVGSANTPPPSDSLR